MWIEQAKEELRQLPWMLGKLVGACIAAGGTGLAVYRVTHSDVPWTSQAYPLAACMAGILLFVLSSVAMKRLPPTPESTGAGMRILPWTLLLLFAGLFLAAIIGLTR